MLVRLGKKIWEMSSQKIWERVHTIGGLQKTDDDGLPPKDKDAAFDWCKLRSVQFVYVILGARKVGEERCQELYRLPQVIWFPKPFLFLCKMTSADHC